MSGILLVAAGAALGAPARWLVDRSMRARWPGTMPWGTLMVNLLGSLLLGLVLAAGAGSGGWGQSVLLFVGTGFCGALTTFSTFSYEVVRLYEGDRPRYASAYLALSLGLGLLLASAGWLLGSLVWQ